MGSLGKTLGEQLCDEIEFSYKWGWLMNLIRIIYKGAVLVTLIVIAVKL